MPHFDTKYSRQYTRKEYVIMKPLLNDIHENIKIIKSKLKNDDTVTYKKITSKDNKIYYVIFIEGLTSFQTVDQYIIQPMFNLIIDKPIIGDTTDYIMNRVICARGIIKSSDIDEIITYLLYGFTIVLYESNNALLVNTQNFPVRSIAEPDSERVIRGPKEGFTESLETNLALVRRKINDPRLKFKIITLGDMSKTRVSICYIDGIAKPKILSELETRLNAVKTDAILDSGYIQEEIKDHLMSPFKTIGNTERPDIVAGKLLEGRIAVICDGSPSALTLPFLFIEYFKSNEDLYTNYVYASFNRLLRILAFFISTSIPAIYLALVSFHQEMIPTPLLLSITASRQDVPFPTFIETLIMLLVFELLREAGIRMPMAIGQAISIVGALVLGEAAVSAHIVSAPIVIIIALTGISSYLIPTLNLAVIIIKFIFLVSSAFLGLYGYIMAVIVFFLYLMSINSFGVPYFNKTSPLDTNNFRNYLLRLPKWLTHTNTNLMKIRSKNNKTSGDNNETN